MIYDCFRVTGALDTVPDNADLFSISLRHDDVPDFDTRWDAIPLSMTKIPPDDVPESLYKLRLRESDQLKAVLELYVMEIHEKISMPNYQKLKTIHEILTPETTELGQGQWSRVAGDSVVLKEEKEFSGKQKGSVRGRPMQFPARRS